MTQSTKSISTKSHKNVKAVEVWLDSHDFGPLTHLGRLHYDDYAVRFEYSELWLNNPAAFALDPQLKLGKDKFYPRGHNFGIFMDSSPDRWGQSLMQKRESMEAREQNRGRRDLTFWDFFLGVEDFTRMGALRISEIQPPKLLKDASFIEAANPFLGKELLTVPALTSFAELQAIAFNLDKRKQHNLTDLAKWLKILVAPGASLGGARPKANLSDPQGDIWIAKFPKEDDDANYGLREYFLHGLATKYGLDVPPATTMKHGHGHHAFITKRFDRLNGRRRFFTSAMALLNKNEHDSSSYLEIAAFISHNGVPGFIDKDLRELYRRVLFNVASVNGDDHLRNHGFIRHPDGWRLAPAYDMNISLKGEGHELAIDDHEKFPELETVIETAEFYRLSKQDARAELDNLRDVFSNWETAARKIKLKADDVLQIKQTLKI